MVRVGACPPVPPVAITQRQDSTDIGADGVGRGDTCQPRGRTVEHGHPAGLVGKHQAIGQIVGADQATRAAAGLRGSESLAVAAAAETVLPDPTDEPTPRSPRRPRRSPRLCAAAPGVRESGAWVTHAPTRRWVPGPVHSFAASIRAVLASSGR